MTDNKGADGSQEPQEPQEQGDGGESRTPKRVIGTPAPAESRHLLATAEAPDPEAAGEELDEERAKRAERIVALFFLLAFLGSATFMVYFIGWSGRHGGMHGVERAKDSNLWLGGSMTVAFLGLAIGITIWVRRLMTSKQVVQQRGDLYSDAETRKEFEKEFLKGADDSGITKRPLLRRTLLLAAAPLGVAPLLLLRDLGPLPEKKLRHTYWGEAARAAQENGKKGVRLVVDGTDRALRVSDFATPGSMITVVPEGIERAPEAMNEIAKAVTILINVPEAEFKPVKGRENWHVGGIVAYSKICTHVGCPAALYEQTSHHILCPCHQSTFDATDGAKVLFGPAARHLPQLPLSEEDGFLIATGDFPEPIGPSFWERG